MSRDNSWKCNLSPQALGRTIEPLIDEVVTAPRHGASEEEQMDTLRALFTQSSYLLNDLKYCNGMREEKIAQLKTNADYFEQYLQGRLQQEDISSNTEPYRFALEGLRLQKEDAIDDVLHDPFFSRTEDPVVLGRTASNLVFQGYALTSGIVGAIALRFGLWGVSGLAAVSLGAYFAYQYGYIGRSESDLRSVDKDFVVMDGVLRTAHPFP